MNKRNNAGPGPRKFKVPQRKEAYKMKAFIRKNKHNSTTKEFRFKSSGKNISEKSKHFVHQKTQLKKLTVPEKGTTHIFSGGKKSMGSNKKI